MDFSGGKKRAGHTAVRALASGAVLAIALAAMPCAAQEDRADGPAAAEGIRRFDIPAQPLTSAVTSFGDQAGLQITVDGAILAGRSSRTVAGNLTPADALSQLLAGTGISFRWVDRRSVALERAPDADGAIALGPVRVQGDGGGRGTGRVRPPADTSGTYTVAATNSATKLDLAIKDTPQIVNIITRQRIEDQNLTQIADVVAQAPGITVAQQGIPGAGRVEYYSRGFPVTNVMLDGVVTTGAASRDFDLWGALDSAIYDRVEIVQGSTGLATGAGDPSGSVNFVRKRPTEVTQAEFKFHYGTWDRWRVEADVAGPLTKDGRLRARLVAANQQGDSWQDRVESKMRTLYGIVEADVAERVMLTGGLLYSNIRVDDAVPFGMSGDPRYSTTTPGGVFIEFPRSYNPATHWSFAEIELLNPFAKLEWHFADDWRLNANYMFSDIRHARRYGTIGQYYYAPERDEASYNFARLDVDGQIHNVDVAVSGQFELFGRKNDVVAGFSGYWGRSYNPIYNFSGAGPTTIPISQWNGGDIPLPTFGLPEVEPGIPFALNNLLTVVSGEARLREKQYGGYIGTRLRPFERVSLILGGRINQWKRSGRTKFADPSALFVPPYEIILVDDPVRAHSYTIDGKFAPYAGIVFDVTKDVTLYASYARIERANIDYNRSSWYLDINGDPLPPLRGDTMEVGAKAGLFDNRLNVQLAGYLMRQENFPVGVSLEGTDLSPSCPFPNPLGGLGCTGPAAPSKGYISKGIDFSLSGRIGPKINLSASYSYLEQEFDYEGHESEEYFGGKYPKCYGSNFEERREGTGIGFSCPRHTVKFFGTYTPIEALTLGGGVVWKSRTRSNWDGLRDVLNQGSFAVVDLMARYRITDQITLSANIYNLFDKKYLANSDGNFSFYGAPRNVLFSLGFKL